MEGANVTRSVSNAEIVYSCRGAYKVFAIVSDKEGEDNGIMVLCDRILVGFFLSKDVLMKGGVCALSGSLWTEKGMRDEHTRGLLARVRVEPYHDYVHYHRSLICNANSFGELDFA